MANGVVDTLSRVFRITVMMSCRLQQMQFSYHLRDVGVPTSTAEDAHADAKAWLNTIYRPALSADVAITRLAVERLVEGSYFAEDFAALNGSGSQQQLITSQALCISLKSNLRSRHANGRMFWPASGAPSNDRASGPGFDTIVTAAAATATRWTGSALLTNRKLVVVGAGIADPATGVLGPPRWTDVETIRVNPVITNLRSRKVGVGS